ncbi:MAG: PGPGW domain-containing protein [Acidimicrobiia bacterium]
MEMERAARIAGGFALLGAGTAMLVLPGPGVLAILGGLTLLERDMPWAKRVTDRIRRKRADKPQQKPEQKADQLGG